ncbi:DUF3971 domain-containing protein [Mesobacterium pallidum]|uniref:DUF3971 domain-containing protein n=1 Tax=Mesobacterium pallidum TaxID=2872037 RepID=UPI001EE23E71|nr:DUF3971 domain-containing protein [Mesobacterium pallidum]
MQDEQGEATAAAPPPRPSRLRHVRHLRHLRHTKHLGTIGVSLLSALATLALVAVLVLPERPLPAPGWVRERVETRLAEAVPQVDVSFGEMVLLVEDGWRPRVRLRDVDIAARGGDHLAALTQIDIVMALSPLMQGQVKPHAIELSGVFLTVRRLGDGSFDFALDTGNALGQSLDVPALMAMLHGTLAADALSALDEAGLRALTLRYEDTRTGRGWTMDGGRIRLARGAEGVEIGGDLALLGGGADVGTLELSLDVPTGSNAAELGLRFVNLEAQDMASQFPALAWLSALRAPISGSMRARLGADAQLADLNATLQIGAGAVQPTNRTRPVPFRSARAYLAFEPASGRLRFDEISMESDWLTVRAEGKAMLQVVREDGRAEVATGWPDQLLAQIAFSEVALTPGDYYPEGLTIDRAALDMRLELDPFRLTLGQASLALEGQALTANGSLAAGYDGWEIALDVTADDVAPQTVVALWPLGVKPRTRAWLDEKLLGGRAENVHFALRLAPDLPPQSHLGLDFTGAELIWMRSMPTLQDATGHLSITGPRMVVVADRAKVVSPQGGLVEIAGSSMVVEDIGQPGAPATLTIDSASTVTAALALLDQEPLNYLTKAGRPVTLADGRADGRTVLTLPLKPGVQPNEVRFDAEVAVTDVRSDTLVPGRVLAAPRLTLRATNEGLQVQGAARLGRVPVTGTWTMPFGQPGAGSRLEGTVELSERFLDEFNIQLPPRSLSGRGEGQLSLELPAGGAPRFTLTSTLAGLGMQLPQIGWGISQGTRGKLRVSGALGTPVSVDSLSLEAPGLDALGRIELDGNGQFRRAVFDRVRAGGWLDAPVTLSSRGRGAAPAIAIGGGRIDMRSLPDSAGGGGGGNAGGPVTLALDRLQVTDQISLTNMRGEFVTNRGLEGAFAGQVNGAAPVSGRVVPQNGRSALQVTSADAGQVLRAAGLLKRARGGEMVLNLVPVGGAGSFDGALRVTNTRLQDAPAMAELLNAISVIGLLDQLNGQGILFSEVDARFRLTPGQVIVSQSSAVGPSMGISMDGYYDTASGAFDMQGVLSPIYLVNAVGAIFTRKGEGLFGFNFNLRGTAEAPQVSVNPLSAFTPGMFREIFRRPPPDLTR